MILDRDDRRNGRLVQIGGALEAECHEEYVNIMKPISEFAIPRGTARRVATAVLASSLFVASAGAVAAASNDQPTTAAPIAAKWVPRKIHFMYLAVTPSSVTTFYSCDRLQEQITAILRQLGAQDEVVKPFGCINGGPGRLPGVDATFSVLEPAGSDDEGAASSKNVEAHWDKVTLTPDTSCALIEQVKQRILPLFATRNQTSGCSPRSSVEALRPVKPPVTDS